MVFVIFDLEYSQLIWIQKFKCTRLFCILNFKINGLIVIIWNLFYYVNHRRFKTIYLDKPFQKRNYNKNIICNRNNWLHGSLKLKKDCFECSNVCHLNLKIFV